MKKGFVLLDIIFVIAILGILAKLAMPKAANSILKAQVNQCKTNRVTIENAANRYMYLKGTLNPSIQTLVDEGYLMRYPRCSAGGTYVWLDDATEENPYRTVGCSIHFPASSTPTPCFVATVVYGDTNALEVQYLRIFRDKVLIKSISGRMFVGIYYRTGPYLAVLVAKSQRTKAIIRYMLDSFIRYRLRRCNNAPGIFREK